MLAVDVDALDGVLDDRQVGENVNLIVDSQLVQGDAVLEQQVDDHLVHRRQPANGEHLDLGAELLREELPVHQMRLATLSTALLLLDERLNVIEAADGECIVNGVVVGVARQDGGVLLLVVVVAGVGVLSMVAAVVVSTVATVCLWKKSGQTD